MGSICSSEDKTQTRGGGLDTKLDREHQALMDQVANSSK
tara:strand:+ start:117 stop:233 length:117 start_codon:yes stop_codon:yes gene_type:complete